MQYTKALVDLIKEARRRAPLEDKPSIKLANPEVLSELLILYQKSKDAVFKAIIKEIFALAGDGWSDQIGTPDTAKSNEVPPGYVVKVYRGQTRLEPKPGSDNDQHRSKRIYRGQVVAT
jgi:hypothetical protein